MNANFILFLFFRCMISLILAFVFMPLFTLLGYWISIQVFQDHSIYSGSFKGYIKANLLIFFFLLPGAALGLVLFPYQVAVFFFKKQLSLWKKVLLFEIIIFTIFSIWYSFADLWSYPYWKNLLYVIYLFVPSFVCTSALHLTVDKKYA
jgi:hypothetical protein